ncbi:hypothetical protein [Pseudomonas sp. SO81]|uniref:hypothetical protein n=1 Tax=Pseudomonas sp. SO81 TaxID=2983246 RepID=UPI0025A42387|nr:hypothetical protein [Pseudomonas sp. SO81]WJN60939.1 hypothetical protein OH686_19515 [Pseudomonas sp. SO81]
MQVGADALNTAPLNGTADGGSPPAPQPIPTGVAFTWRDQVLVAGVDVSAQVTGVPEVDRERGAAGIADFDMFMADDPNPAEWVGREVIINYLSTSGGVTTSARLFTGHIEETSWNPNERLLSCACSDRLQQRVERLTIAEVDALIPCYWSADVFEPAEGRSRWEYAEERLSTVRASLDCDVNGTPRLTTWYAGPVDYDFGPDTTVYQSVEVIYADLSTLTNVVEIEADYRYPRLRQLVTNYSWQHPGTGGATGIPGFCAWRPESTELPDVEMLRSATDSSGQVMVNASFTRLPPSAGDPCGTGVPWVNGYSELVLGATWGGIRRWVQSVTEQYQLRVEAISSVSAVGEVIVREGSAVEIESDRTERWEQSLERMSRGGLVEGSYDTEDDDLRAEDRRQLFLRCQLNQAATTIVRAHNASGLAWDTPTSLVMGVDLGHTLKMNDQGVAGIGRCSRLQHRLDKASGVAMTTLTIAVMRGGGSVNDPLTPPPIPAEPPPGSGGEPVTPGLITQLGGSPDSGDYDDDADGFSGNYDNFDPSYPRFPRRFAITAPEIAAEMVDEQIIQVGQTYRIAIPNDLLEL